MFTSSSASAIRRCMVLAWRPALVTCHAGVRAATGPDSDRSGFCTTGSARTCHRAAYTAAIKRHRPHNPVPRLRATRYNYAFGKESPFLPSNAMTANGQFISPKSVSHRRVLRPLPPGGLPPVAPVRSLQQLSAPWYLKNVNMLIDEKGVQFSRHCEGCHNPIALFSGDLSQGMPKTRPFEDEGVTCSICHSIQSTDTTGTGSYVMGIPAVLVDENGAPVTRPVTDAEILGPPRPALQGRDAPAAQDRRILRRLPQGHHPALARRLQVPARLHRLRRVAGRQLHQAVAASLLPQRCRLHLPDLPHAARSADRRRRTIRRQGRQARLASLAGRQHASSPPTTSSTSRPRSSSTSSRTASTAKASSTSTSSRSKKKAPRRRPKTLSNSLRRSG